MNEKLSINELINYNSEIIGIDHQISNHEKEIKNQEKDYDFHKPSIEYWQRNINKLLEERDLVVKSIIERTKSDINKLRDKYGEEYFVHYSKEDWFIQIHRSNCEEYRIWVNGSDLKSEKCKSFKDAKIKANSLNKDVITDISDDCIECQPHLNLQSILKSI
jgi:hypothetical protein